MGASARLGSEGAAGEAPAALGEPGGDPTGLPVRGSTTRSGGAWSAPGEAAGPAAELAPSSAGVASRSLPVSGWVGAGLAVGLPVPVAGASACSSHGQLSSYATVATGACAIMRTAGLCPRAAVPAQGRPHHAQMRLQLAPEPAPQLSTAAVAPEGWQSSWPLAGGDHLRHGLAWRAWQQPGMRASRTSPGCCSWMAWTPRAPRPPSGPAQGCLQPTQSALVCDCSLGVGCPAQLLLTNALTAQIKQEAWPSRRTAAAFLPPCQEDGSMRTEHALAAHAKWQGCTCCSRRLVCGLRCVHALPVWRCLDGLQLLWGHAAANRGLQALPYCKPMVRQFNRVLERQRISRHARAAQSQTTPQGCRGWHNHHDTYVMAAACNISALEEPKHYLRSSDGRGWLGRVLCWLRLVPRWCL